jgi:chromate transport protein ChrA
LKITAPGPPVTNEASVRARHQLRRVLLVLAAMDVGVLVTIVVLALASVLLHLSSVELLGLIVAGLGAIIGARVALAVRLRRRSGDF